MNLYVILNHAISNIGGGQLYVNSKREFMESLGWDVRIYSCSGDNVLINELKAHLKYVIPELGILPMYLCNKVRNKVLETMADGTGSYDKIIIESNATHLSVWGEMLASKIHAKHIIYNLDENPTYDKSLLPFFKFKLDRLEIAGITLDSIPNFFRPYICVPKSEKYCLTAYYSQKRVDDVECDLTNNLVPADYTIGVVGRLAKPFILSTVDGIIEFARKHKNNTINVVYIGGDDKGGNVEEQLCAKYQGIDNVNLYLAGYMFPMPLSLLKKFDVVVSSSGACWTVAQSGCVVISIDGKDNLPIGVLGITTLNILFRKDEPIKELPYWLDEVLVNKVYKAAEVNMPKANNDMKSRLQHHLDFIDNSNQVLTYYTDFKISSMMKKIIASLLGFKIYSKLRNHYH